MVFILAQSRNISIDKYYEEFKAFVVVIETYGRTFVEPSVIENKLTLASMVM